jgi:hypothetical protein
MFDPLIDRKDGKVSCASQTSLAEKRLKASEHRRGPVAGQPHPIDEVRTREVQLFLRHCVAFVLEKIARSVTEQFCDPVDGSGFRHVRSSLNQRAELYRPFLPPATDVRLPGCAEIVRIGERCGTPACYIS